VNETSIDDAHSFAKSTRAIAMKNQRSVPFETVNGLARLTVILNFVNTLGGRCRRIFRQERLKTLQLWRDWRVWRFRTK
jgi:hypothetical protein